LALAVDLFYVSDGNLLWGGKVKPLTIIFKVSVTAT
jgi:hypothetical protein